MQLETWMKTEGDQSGGYTTWQEFETKDEEYDRR
jgi:hypothetical protein